MRLTLITVLLCVASSVMAAELPAQGVFGTDKRACVDAKANNEGDFVSFEGMSAGHGGNGGCDFTTVRKSGANTYTLGGVCFDLDGTKLKRTLKLVVKSKDTIFYDDRDYRRCGK